MPNNILGVLPYIYISHTRLAAFLLPKFYSTVCSWFPLHSLTPLSIAFGIKHSHVAHPAEACGSRRA